MWMCAHPAAAAYTTLWDPSAHRDVARGAGPGAGRAGGEPHTSTSFPIDQAKMSAHNNSAHTRPSDPLQ